jgi:uncharacterized protein (DUF1800 family)
VTDQLRSDLAHLYRRAGYGATPSELDAAVVVGYEATVERMLDRTTPDVAADAVAVPDLTTVLFQELETIEERRARGQARRAQRVTLAQWWVQRMVRAQIPLREKLTWLWHDHFATSFDKVAYGSLMYGQNLTFRKFGAGNFEELVQNVAKDPAMMVFLDTNKSKKGAPNENFARELMELFTLGIGNYTDGDVREAARAFTSWRVQVASGLFRDVPGQGDGGPKSILGQTAPFTGEQVVALLARAPSTARYITAKLWSGLAYPVLPDDAVVSQLAPTFAANLEITPLLRSIFLHPQFRSVQARQGLVKEPVEFVAGSLRALGIDIGYLDLSRPPLYALLDQLGQVPFDPPSVGGWPQNGYWVSTATALARLRFAQTAVAAAPTTWLDPVRPADRPATIAARFGIDGFTAGTTAALSGAPNARVALTLALVSPENTLN